MDPRDAPVRVGDTVRRAAGSSRVAVRDLLIHLESVGFDGAPRYLGMDDQDREVLSWIDGDVPLPPYPAWAMTDRALADLGGLVRRLHEATATFRDTAAELVDPVGRSGRRTLICHNDLYPENVVFRDGRVVALIDFAMAAPGRPLWDVAIAGETWGPLGDPKRRDRHPAEPRRDRATRGARPRLQAGAGTRGGAHRGHHPGARPLHGQHQDPDRRRGRGLDPRMDGYRGRRSSRGRRCLDRPPPRGADPGRPGLIPDPSTGVGAVSLPEHMDIV